MGVLVAGCLALGVGLFALLEGRRHEQTAQLPQTAPADASRPAPSPPPLEIPPPPPPPPAPVQPIQPPPKPAVQIVDRPAPQAPPVIQYVAPPPPNPPAPPGAARLPEPALVIDLSEAPDAAKGPDQAHATVLRHRSMIIPQGTIIAAVLETPINSSAPGFVRAITSKDIRGFDGARVLIPRGSRLYGQFQADIRAGQSRVLVTWSDLIRPDGVTIKLNSPAADANGRMGIPGSVNNHVLARFTSAILQSALSFGENYAYRPTSGGSVVVSAPIQATGGASGALIPSAQAQPTIDVGEGADIAVLVARDLDFSGALPRQ